MQPGPQPIVIVTTGGTIDKAYFDALSTYQITDTVIARLLEIARVTLPFEIVEIARKDSLELDDEDRARLVAAARDAPWARRPGEGCAPSAARGGRSSPTGRSTGTPPACGSRGSSRG